MSSILKFPDFSLTLSVFPDFLWLSLTHSKFPDHRNPGANDVRRQTPKVCHKNGTSNSYRTKGRLGILPSVGRQKSWYTISVKNCIYAAVFSCWFGVPLVSCICRLGWILLLCANKRVHEYQLMGWVILIINGGVDLSSLQGDSWIKSTGLVWGSAAALRCSTSIR